MKRIILLLALSCCISCSAQRIEQKPLKRVVAYVDEKDGAVARLSPNDPDITYKVPDGDFVLNKEYVFYLDIQDNQKGRVITATVERYAITTGQAQRDQAQCVKELANRKIY